MNRSIAVLIALFTMPVHAQIPVTDSLGIAETAVQHVQTLLKWREQYQQMSEQFVQLQRTHTALTGVRNLGDVFDSRELRQYLPEDWNRAYRRMKREGYEGLVREGVAIYESNRIHDACEDLQPEDVRIACESRAVKASQDQADASELFDKTLERGEQIRQLQAQINATEDPKAIAELNARLSVEQAAIANEATRISIIKTITEAEERVQAQRQKEFQARAWSATKGVELEPLTFDQ